MQPARSRALPILMATLTGLAAAACGGNNESEQVPSVEENVNTQPRTDTGSPAPAPVPMTAFPAVPPATATPPADTAVAVPPPDRYAGLDATESYYRDSARIAFSVPDTARFQREFRVDLALSPDTTVPLTAGLPAVGVAPDSAHVPFSPVMEAGLTGEGFSIEALSPERQNVSRRTPTVWSWAVTPTEYGARPLHLSLTMVIAADGGAERRFIRSFDRRIAVHVAPLARISTLLDRHSWIWYIIGPAGFLALLVRVVLGRRRKAPGEA